jgi:hypothetical protein
MVIHWNDMGYPKGHRICPADALSLPLRYRPESLPRVAGKVFLKGKVASFGLMSSTGFPA